jgi:hypothetical protein
MEQASPKTILVNLLGAGAVQAAVLGAYPADLLKTGSQRLSGTMQPHGEIVERNV